MRGSAILAAALGAAGMYLLDPARGHRRRTLVRDVATHQLRRATARVADTACDAANRARGRIADLRARAAGEEVDDVVLVERVRAAMGHAVHHPHVDVQVADGRVTLVGALPGHEAERLVRRVRAVRGVRHVASQLDIASQLASA
jgi:osmotically-inducible protein OsmY